MRRVVVALLVLGAFATSGTAEAMDGSGDGQHVSTLAECAAAIERASQPPDGERVVLGHLSRKLHMSVEVLRAQRLRSQLGWGDILIANHLTSDTLSFDQVIAKFKTAKSWEQVARDHGADPAALLVDVQRSREIVEGREEDKAAPREHLTGSSPGTGRAGGTGRTRR